ncbi:hypothetical protein DPPLL_00090 [Desulfofustis limnaeus]|uniref:Uncharacterized protein n=1 Tax=Desulfofustis limnaeus TaxID=2740163 RepID=A0ABM7W488_9BACT|nr:hypothetical protein DPPLL_00090 [Desulfofustis limnaeus]
MTSGRAEAKRVGERIRKEVDDTPVTYGSLSFRSTVSFEVRRLLSLTNGCIAQRIVQVGGRCALRSEASGPHPYRVQVVTG